MVSPLAYIHPEAKIGENVEIAPFVFIDKNVVIGDNNKIMANANILYGSRIGNGNTIFPGAVIGAVPQDLKFRGEESTAEIGDNNLIRENVTVNRGTAAKGRTIVGNNNLLMEGVHVAHDALVGNGCIIGNSTKMAGEIVIDDNAIVSANVLMHQFCHVGSHVMIQGGCRFSKDIPPYIIAGREPIAFSGINIIGLRRRGFANEVIESIHNAYRIIYQSGLNTTDALKKIEDEYDIAYFDLNPSFSIYTQIALAATSKLLLPVMADDSSRRAIQNAFSLIYGLKLPSEIYTKYAFAQKLKDEGRQLPKVHMILKNRLTQYMGPASAFATVLSAIEADISDLLKVHPHLFTFSSIDDGIINIRDFGTTGVVSAARGCPFYILPSGRLYVLGQRVQIKEDYRIDCEHNIREITSKIS